MEETEAGVEAVAEVTLPAAALVAHGKMLLAVAEDIHALYLSFLSNFHFDYLVLIVEELQVRLISNMAAAAVDLSTKVASRSTLLGPTNLMDTLPSLLYVLSFLSFLSSFLLLFLFRLSVRILSPPRTLVLLLTNICMVELWLQLAKLRGLLLIHAPTWRPRLHFDVSSLFLVDPPSLISFFELTKIC